jgi:hypothetical protein
MSCHGLLLDRRPCSLSSTFSSQKIIRTKRSRVKYNVFFHQLVVTPPNDFKFMMREAVHDRLGTKIKEVYTAARALSAKIKNLLVALHCGGCSRGTPSI